MAVCKRCGCAIPLGQKTCDICEPRIAAGQAPVWGQQAAPSQPQAWQPAPPAQPQAWQAAPPAQPQAWQVVQPESYQAPQPQAVAGAQAQTWQAPQGVMPASELAASAQAWAARAPGMLTAETAPKAGFWMRVLAWFIDGICIGIPAYAVAHVLLHGDTATYYGISLIFEACYFMYFWSAYGKGQTIAMQLLHMKVVRTDGSLLSLSGAFIRFIGIIAAALPLDLGLIWVAFDAQKQGWHDKIAKTYVISNW